jgi:23S rRNA G2445 N2-methylase RlmL
MSGAKGRAGLSLDQQQYFARVTAGLEHVAWRDIERRIEARLIGFGHRRIDFAYAGPPAALLELRSVDDVHVYVARLGGLDHTRASLGRITQKIGQLDFAAALATCASIRPIGGSPTYRVTASHLGRRNYSRYDVEGAVDATLAKTVPWRFVPNDPEEDEPDLDLRVLLEADWALIGLRLGRMPLHRRAYKVASRPGSLKPPVAYCLCLLAELAPGDVLLDPACGAGTILVEASALVHSGLILGGDIDESALVVAKANLEAVGLRASVVALNQIDELRSTRLSALETAPPLHGTHQPIVALYQGDATDLPLPDRIVDALVTNLPWGQQVSAGNDLAELYLGMLRTSGRVLAARGRAVLLTDQSEQLLAALAECPALRLSSSLQISLYGRHPTIYVLEQA